MTEPHTLSAGDWMTFFATLIAIAALLATAYWLLRRMHGAGGRRKNGRRIDVLDSAMLGPRQRLLLVRAADKEVLIGISGESLTPLLTWSAAELASRRSSSDTGEEEVAEPPTMSGQSFKRIFARMQPATGARS